MYQSNAESRERYEFDSEGYVVLNFKIDCYFYNQTVTLTFGDQAENHVGMQKLGKLAKHGFSTENLNNIYNSLKNKIQCELIDLNQYVNNNNTDKACILILRRGVDFILNHKNSNDLFKEQTSLNVDKKAFMYGRVVNKHARHNLCFAEKSQEPDYEHGKGRVVAFSKVPVLNELRNRMGLVFGEKSKNLMVEGNYYYDINKCGIGFHGDSERKKVIGVRLGCSLPLHFQWFYKGTPEGQRVQLMLNHGDIYIMSEKATGNDWKMKNIYTLRHAAGCNKFLNIK